MMDQIYDKIKTVLAEGQILSTPAICRAIKEEYGVAPDKAMMNGYLRALGDIGELYMIEVGRVRAYALSKASVGVK